MKPETRTITHLFELDVRYVVPLYQRPYVWKKDEQWEPLWDDILTLLEHQESGNHYYSHFLGAIVLDQNTPIPGEIPVFTVIDGQQRLTTLQIILAAGVNVAAELGAEDEAEIIRDLVRNNEKKASGVALLKVWPTNRNRDAFEAVMGSGGPSSDRDDDPENQIDEAYAFFRDTIKGWLLEGDEETRPGRMRLLRITLCELLKVVTITLEADDNAQVIFETLNARGAPLLALDLVKNAVFLDASRQGIETDALYEKVWRPEFDDPEDDKYWRRLKRQGRLNRPNAELFLMHWLTMKLRQMVPATELFGTFRERILGAVPQPDVSELIPELCRDARVIRSFDTQQPGSIEATFFERLEALDTSTVIPLVLFLFRESTLDAERRRRALRMIESWLVRRMLLGLTAQGYNQQIPVIIGRVAEDAEHADEVILEELRTGVGEISRWPTDDEVRTALLDRNLYGYIAQARVVMVLRAIEMSLYTSKVEAIAVPKKLTIEHVMPQTWQKSWPLAADLQGDGLLMAEEARQARIHRLGNLTLTTQPLNSAMSNAPWLVKQKELNTGSKLLLNAYLVQQHPEVFDETAIDDRSRELTEVVIRTWPGPDDPSWGGLATVPIERPAVSATPVEARPDSLRSDDASNGEELRASVVEKLTAGMTPDRIYTDLGRTRAVWLMAIEEEARRDGVLNSVEPTPDAVANLRDERNLRWERIAARVFGDPRKTREVRELYDTARGAGASKRSYTGRGRRFSSME